MSQNLAVADMATRPWLRAPGHRRLLRRKPRQQSAQRARVNHPQLIVRAEHSQFNTVGSGPPREQLSFDALLTKFQRLSDSLCNLFPLYTISSAVLALARPSAFDFMSSADFSSGLTILYVLFVFLKLWMFLLLNSSFLSLCFPHTHMFHKTLCGVMQSPVCWC